MSKEVNNMNKIKTLALAILTTASITTYNQANAQTKFSGIFNNKPGIENSRNRFRISAKKVIPFQQGRNLVLYGFSDLYNNGSFSRFLPTYNFAKIGKNGESHIGTTINTKHIHKGNNNVDFTAIGVSYTYIDKNKQTIISAKALAPAYNLQQNNFKTGTKKNGVIVGLAGNKTWNTTIGDITISAFGEVNVSDGTWIYGESKLSYTPKTKKGQSDLSIQIGTDLLSNGTAIPSFDPMISMTYTIGN